MNYVIAFPFINLHVIFSHTCGVRHVLTLAIPKHINNAAQIKKNCVDYFSKEEGV
uniref:Uncharacterized protein n=1 Tax=Arundo donax TaxID=35708 RepID=A0A0A9HL03_ARUDO